MTDNDILERLVFPEKTRTVEEVQADLNQALIVRRRAIDHATVMHEAAKAAAERTRHLETVLADVWRWTNSNPADVTTLTPILVRADADYRVIAALNAIRESD